MNQGSTRVPLSEMAHSSGKMSAGVLMGPLNAMNFVWNAMKCMCVCVFKCVFLRLSFINNNEANVWYIAVNAFLICVC